jgi:hypothetical protein
MIYNRITRYFLYLFFIIFVPSIFAQSYEGPIFDAHIHYNIEAYDQYPVDNVLNKIEENGVKAFLSNSRTNRGTIMLAEEINSSRAFNTKIIPFIRLYRNRDDYTNWFRDPTIYQMVLDELETGTVEGPFLGIGEFHLYDSQNAHGETAVKLMKLSVEKNLVILAHVDDVAIDILMSYAPQAKIIWAHTGISGVPVTRVESLLKKYPNLMGELSYRPGLTGSNGLLNTEWRSLILSMADRFLVGSDTWTNSRWESYSQIMQNYRTWLGGLPREEAEKVAWKNGYNLFGLD